MTQYTPDLDLELNSLKANSVLAPVWFCAIFQSGMLVGRTPLWAEFRKEFVEAFGLCRSSGQAQVSVRVPVSVHL